MDRNEIMKAIGDKNSKIEELKSRKTNLDTLAAQLVFSNSESDILNMGQIGEEPKALFLQVGALMPNTGYNANLMKLKNTIYSAKSQIDDALCSLNSQVLNLMNDLLKTPEEE